jgi:hypothetical protein
MSTAASETTGALRWASTPSSLIGRNKEKAGRLRTDVRIASGSETLGIRKHYAAGDTDMPMGYHGVQQLAFHFLVVHNVINTGILVYINIVPRFAVLASSSFHIDLLRTHLSQLLIHLTQMVQELGT